MKKLTVLILFILTVLLASFAATACTNTTVDGPMLRFHIRANSNSQADQAVKLLVRDAVLEYLEPHLDGVTGLDSATRELRRLSPSLRSTADRVLRENGFSYRAAVSVGEEFFPARKYGSVVVQSGYYTAVIISLGSGEGDNWWCVLYPPLCYLEARGNGSFRYRSKILDLIDRHFRN